MLCAGPTAQPAAPCMLLGVIAGDRECALATAAAAPTAMAATAAAAAAAAAFGVPGRESNGGSGGVPVQTLRVQLRRLSHKRVQADKCI